MNHTSTESHGIIHKF